MSLFTLQHLKRKKLFGEDRDALQCAEIVNRLTTDKGEKFHTVYIVALGTVFAEIKQDHILHHSSTITTAAHLGSWDFPGQSEAVLWEQEERDLALLFHLEHSSSHGQPDASVNIKTKILWLKLFKNSFVLFFCNKINTHGYHTPALLRKSKKFKLRPRLASTNANSSAGERGHAMSGSRKERESEQSCACGNSPVEGKAQHLGVLEELNSLITENYISSRGIFKALIIAWVSKSASEPLCSSCIMGRGAED